jgi:uncharacterized C2H2 Zn-finger protein
MTKARKTGKCPRCGKTFPHTRRGNAAYQRHYAHAHYTKKAKKPPAAVRKVPGFAKRRR